MATPRFAWGIDIGNRALKAVKLVSTAEGLAIDDFDVIEHENVLSASGDNRDAMIQTALANFVQRHPGIEKGQVGVGVTGQQSFARFIKLPPVVPNKIPEIVRFEAIQQIPFPLDEVEWSYQLFQDPESPEVEVGIFAMRKDLVNQHIKFFTDAKLNVQAVQMNPLAVYNAMYYDSRIKGTTMIIDVGAENTDLIIAEGETIWLRSISIGGNNFTDALTKTFKVNFAKAEELKRNASTSKYGRQIMQAMRPIFADLVSEIQRSIGFYSSVHKESRINKVIAVGSTFRLPGLQKYLSQNLTLDVEKLDRLSTGAMPDPKSAALFSENLLSAAGAYGLALQVMGQGKISSSLLPESIRRDKMWAEKNKWFVAAAALFLVGAMIPYGRVYFEHTTFHDSEHDSLRADIEEEDNAAHRADTDWASIEQSGTAEKQIMLNVRSLSDGRLMWPQINTLLYNTLPQNGETGQKELASSDPDEIRKIKRGDRNQIIMTAMVSRYYADLNPFLAPGSDLATQADQSSINTVPFETGGTSLIPFRADNANTAGAPTPDPTAVAAAPAKPQRGFVLTLKLSTPSSRGVELVEAYNNALKGLNPTPDRPLQVLGAKIVKQQKIKDDPTRLAALVTQYQARLRAKEEAAKQASIPGDGAGGPGAGNPGGHGMRPPFEGGPLGGGGGPFGGGGGPFGGGGNAPNFGGGNTGPVVPEEAYQDPVLKEDIRDDTECIVVLAVSIDPAPPAATPAAGKTVASAAGQPGQP
jgi:type IV pilus assembly protein PilM